MTQQRPSRVRTMPPHEVDQHAAVEPAHEAELVHRLELALAQLPEAERTAVISAIAYGGGPVGVAMELGLEISDADALTRNAVQLLRGALSEVDAHGTPLLVGPGQHEDAGRGEERPRHSGQPGPARRRQPLVQHGDGEDHGDDRLGH